MKCLAFAATWLGVLQLAALGQNVLDAPQQGNTSIASAGAATVPNGGYCVVNGAAVSLLFITETREGTRQSAHLAPGERLCAGPTQADNGIVSIFESAASFEGCSRIVAVGNSESMLKFAEAGRCGWSSHNS